MGYKIGNYSVDEKGRKVYELSCDMVNDCTEPVEMIDDKGYAYCHDHGHERREVRPCRKLRGWELRRLQRGDALTKY